jgi:hypothetical protein
MPGLYPPGAPAPRFGGGGSAYGSFKPFAPDAAATPYPSVAPGTKAQGSSISLYFKGGRLFATIYDANGRIMMTGPVESLRNQKNLPRDARRALEQLRDDGARDGKDKPDKVRKHRQRQEDEDDDNDEDDDAPRGR